MKKYELLKSLTDKQIRMLMSDFYDFLLLCKHNQAETAIGFTLSAFFEVQKKHEKLFKGLDSPADVLAIGMMCHEVTIRFLTRIKQNAKRNLRNKRNLH